jgi:hypothetical protein
MAEALACAAECLLAHLSILPFVQLRLSIKHRSS